MIYIRCAFRAFTVGIVIGSYDNIAIPISIYISCRSNTPGKASKSLVIFHCGSNSCINAGCRSMIDKYPPFISFTIVVPVSPDNNIAVSITVYISCTANRLTHECTYLVTFYRCCSNSADTGCRAMINKCPAFISFTIVIPEGPHNHITEPITIHISCGRNSIAKISICLVTFHHRCCCSAEAGYRSVVYKGNTLVSFSIVESMCSYNHITVSISIYITC